MAELLVFRGPPASGKSTAAMGMQDTHVRVNRDDIRRTMYGVYWGGNINEEVVTGVENSMIESALRAGQNVLVDATNLNNKLLRTKLSIASQFGADVVFEDFEIPVDVAIERDLGRTRTVGAGVIRGFYKHYKINPETGKMKPPPLALPTFEPYVVDLTKPKAFIVDTDGTVANHEGVRNPYDTSRYHLDSVHEAVREAVNGLFEYNEIIALSGRDESFREVTENWWIDNEIGFSKFFMRPAGDTRMDAIIKYELFKEHIEPNFNVLGAFDDRPQVIRMWRAIGVPVFDVGKGVDF